MYWAQMNICIGLTKYFWFHSGPMYIRFGYNQYSMDSVPQNHSEYLVVSRTKPFFGSVWFGSSVSLFILRLNKYNQICFCILIYRYKYLLKMSFSAISWGSYPNNNNNNNRENYINYHISPISYKIYYISQLLTTHTTFWLELFILPSLFLPYFNSPSSRPVRFNHTSLSSRRQNETVLSLSHFPWQPAHILYM